MAMMIKRRMNRSDFNFEVPPELIAEHPCEYRSSSRLLRVPARGAFSNHVFRDVAKLLRRGDLVVVNDSRVIRARLFARKEKGGSVEILVERLLSGRRALALLRARRAPREETRLIAGGETLRVLGRRGDLFVLALETQCTFSRLLSRCGEVPLPPYIRRPVEESDKSRYQAVYAKRPGSVAAPTAGLHFDKALLARLARKGVEVAALTLHVGAGTFRPLRGENLDEHVMHHERLDVGARLCAAVAACRRRGGRVVAVGTTVVRALETAADGAGRVCPYKGETGLFIRPGYRFRVPEVMITNFHLPRTTLFVLVCAFAGRRRAFDAYRYAVERRYRFFSYGDATWLEKNDAV